MANGHENGWHEITPKMVDRAALLRLRHHHLHNHHPHTLTSKWHDQNRLPPGMVPKGSQRCNSYSSHRDQHLNAEKWKLGQPVARAPRSQTKGSHSLLRVCHLHRHSSHDSRHHSAWVWCFSGQLVDIFVLPPKNEEKRFLFSPGPHRSLPQRHLQPWHKQGQPSTSLPPSVVPVHAPRETVQKHQCVERLRWWWLGAEYQIHQVRSLLEKWYIR